VSFDFEITTRLLADEVTMRVAPHATIEPIGATVAIREQRIGAPATIEPGRRYSGIIAKRLLGELFLDQATCFEP
jgi:hypothetical protein